MRKSATFRMLRIAAWAGAVLVVVVSTILWMASGVIPLSGRTQAVDLFESAPDGLILGYSAGWEDHKTFLWFAAESSWVAKAVANADLSNTGIAKREVCLGAPSSPWWIRIRPNESGQCWKRKHGYGGGTLLHYDEASGYVYVYDYST